MLRIGLAYMNVSNLGDVIIYETARYLIEQILKESHGQDYELVPIDIGSFYARKQPYGYSDRIKAKKAELKLNNLLKTSGDPDKIESALLEKWHLSRQYLYFKQHEQPKLQGLDGLIFTGGGLIKYHKQNFHYFLHEITQIALRDHFPVCLNAVGVEGYSETDPECQLLKKALNQPCVKYVSTRDDFAVLRNNFITNPDIRVEAVCDPALWTKECYQIKRSANADKKIGLGVIRTEIFKDYMYYIDQNRLIDVYFALAKRITEMGYQVEFFSNGVKNDNTFIHSLFAAYPSLKKEYNVSIAKPQTTKELVSTIAGYERFVSIRLHASIIGCSLGVPNVSLVWNIKQQLFGQQMGLSQNYLTKESFDEDIILEKLFQAEKPEIDPVYKESVHTGLISQIHIIEKEKEKE